MADVQPRRNAPDGWGSLRAYARHRRSKGLAGGSHEAVRRAIESGRITPPDSRGWLSFERADAEWGERTAFRVDFYAPRVRRAIEELPLRADGHPDFTAISDLAVRCRTARDYWAAADREQRVRVARGELLEMQRVEVAVAHFAVRWRQEVFQVAPRLIPRLLGETDPKAIGELLRAELKAVCDAADDRMPKVMEACNG